MNVRDSGRVLEPRLAAALSDDVGAELGPDAEWADREVRGDFSEQAGVGLEVTGCRLLGVNLTATALERARITDTVFQNCDLSGARLSEASLSRVQFSGCRMLGVVLSQTTLRDVRFSECRIGTANLRMGTAERIEFDHCDLTDADFYAARFSHARLFDCDLTGAEFSQAKMNGARFHGSTLANLKGAASLRGITIDTAQMLPMAHQVFAALGLTVDDERDPITERAAATRRARSCP